MNQKNAVQILFENLRMMDQAVRWLNRSYEICLRIGIKKDYSDEDWDAFETLAARFGRSVDIIINKVFRSIDRLELEETGSLIDSVNRAEKRGITPSAEEIRLLKELRNEIVHEYKNDNLLETFQTVLNAVPKVLAVVDKIRIYCKKYN